MHPSDKKLNILYITPKKELIGGGAAQAVQLVKELSNKGHKWNAQAHQIIGENLAQYIKNTYAQKIKK